MGQYINQLAAPEVPDLNYGQLHVDIILSNYPNENYKNFENLECFKEIKMQSKLSDYS